jgi:hypothetical protein
MLYCHWTILDLVTISVASIPKELLDLPRILTYYSKSLCTKLYDKHDDVLFVLLISRWSVVTLHPLLKASPQRFYGRHTESVDRYGVSISTVAPGPCSRFWRSPSCSCTFSFMYIFFYFICASRCICLRFHFFVFVRWLMSFGFRFNRGYPWFYFHLVTT